MSHRLALSPGFTIRSLETHDEIETYFRLNAQTFRPDEDTTLVMDRRRRLVVDDPDFHAIQLRGAFWQGVYVGGYRIQERWLCLGSARVHTGCIGGVVTHPGYRHQGIATALMRDALAFAHTHQYAFLLLHGIPNFYQQFGFIDVLEDLPRYALNRTLIPTQPPTGYTVRYASLYDAPAILAFYQEHYGPYLGSFAPTRTVERQAHYLQNWFQENIPLLALNTKGEPEGYLLLSRRWKRLYAYEVAASTWPAILALLQNHSQLLDAEPEQPDELWWPLPSASATYYLLADQLPLRGELSSSPNQGWMACPVSLSTLLQSLLPLWQDRLRQRRLVWTGVLALSVGDYTAFLEIQPQGLRFVQHPSGFYQHVSISQQIFTQLIFGFRPVTWATTQPGQHIPAELIPLLDVLFPLSQAWIAGSDYF